MVIISHECKSCGSTLVRLKLFNKITFSEKIVYSIVIGIGVGAGGVLIYNIYKNTKRTRQEIADLNAKVDCLVKRLDAGLPPVSSVTTPTPTTQVSISNSQPTLTRRYDSYASLSDLYQTPNTTPDTSDDEYSDSEEQFKDPIDDSIANNLNRLDNRQSRPIKSVLKRKLPTSTSNVVTPQLVHQSIEYIKEKVDETEKKYEQDQKNVDLLVDYTRSLFAYAERIEDNDELRDDLYKKCYQLAKKAVDLDDKTFVTHKLYVITIGRVLEKMGLNEKVKMSVNFKKHLEMAIKLNENDYHLLYIRGRWIYTLLELTWAEKAAVRLIYGKIPSCNIDAALQDFLKAESLFPNQFKSNLLYLAKCYISKKEYEKALEQLNKAVKLPSITISERLDNTEIESLIEKYSDK